MPEGLDWDCPYRTSQPSGVTIECGKPLTGANNAPAKRNALRHVVLYTHDSPFITARSQLVKKMTTGDFQRLSERYGYPGSEIAKFHKFFVKQSVGKGIDQRGLGAFLAKFANVDPTDVFVQQRLFDVTNKRGHPSITFEQTMGLFCTIVPPVNQFDPEANAAMEAPNTINKAQLFFDLCDIDDSGQLGRAEIDVLCRIHNTERLDVAKERRKMMLEKVMNTILEKFHKLDNPHAQLTREELIHAVGTIEHVHAFFSKGLFIARNLQQDFGT